MNRRAKHMKARLTDFQKQGELKKTKAALAELDRFKKEKSPTTIRNAGLFEIGGGAWIRTKESVS